MANVVDPQSPNPMPQPQQSGSGKGCLYGCLLVVGLCVAGIICTGVGTYFFLSKQIEKYTSDQPMELPTVEYPEEKMAELESRVEGFKTKLDAGETPDEDLVLTADDVNALIGKNEDLKGRVYVKIEDDQIKGDVSFPLDEFPLPGTKGRFFNGSATFDVSMDGGVLIVTANEASVNNEPLPEEFMQGLRNENLAKDAYKDADNAKFLRQFEDIRVEDNKIYLRVKRDADSDAGASDGEASDIQTNPNVVDDAPVETEPEELSDDQPGEASAETADAAAAE